MPGRPPHNPPPDPPTWGDFSISVGESGDWYNRRGSSVKGEIEEGDPQVGGMTITRIRPNGNDIVVNITGGERYVDWNSATPHTLFVTGDTWECICPPSTTSSAFGNSFGRYRVPGDDRSVIAAVSADDVVQITFVRG